MIIKVIPADHGGIDRFRRLHRYILNKMVWGEFSNVSSLESAARDMERTAMMNARVKKPCYHLAISLHPEDTVGLGPAQTEALLRTVLARVVDKIGIHGYQWIAAAHDDAAHSHLHLMLNRVHPGTSRALALGYDHYKLRKIALALEKELTLTETRFLSIGAGDAEPQVDSPRAPAKIAKRSFKAWLAGAPRRAMLRALAGKWPGLHEALASFGLRYKIQPVEGSPNGYGGVIQDAFDETLRVGASSVSRELSLQKLGLSMGFPSENVAIPNREAAYSTLRQTMENVVPQPRLAPGIVQSATAAGTLEDASSPKQRALPSVARPFPPAPSLKL